MAKVTLGIFNRAWIAYSERSVAACGQTDDAWKELNPLWNAFIGEFQHVFGHHVQDIDRLDQEVEITGPLLEKLRAWASRAGRGGGVKEVQALCEQ